MTLVSLRTCFCFGSFPFFFKFFWGQVIDAEKICIRRFSFSFTHLITRESLNKTCERRKDFTNSSPAKGGLVKQEPLYFYVFMLLYSKL